MTQEEKHTLLVDLCSRLPYGVKLKFYLPLNTHFVIETLRDIEFRNEDIFICSTTWNAVKLEFCKPYLRPMSSMTEEEKEELRQEHVKDEKLYAECLTRAANGDGSMRGKVITHFAADWCNKNHFDYRGLIPMGLALEVPEGMYDIKHTKSEQEQIEELAEIKKKLSK